MAKQAGSKSIERTHVRIDQEIKRLIPKYLNNRRADMRAILEALKKEDFKTIRALGHAMKGFGKTYGFDSITGCGNNLEVATFEKEPFRVQKSVELFTNYLERLGKSFLNKLMTVPFACNHIFCYFFSIAFVGRFRV